MLLWLFFQILWSGKPVLHECNICNVVTYVTLVVFCLYLSHYVMCGGGRIFWVYDSGEIIELRLLLEQYFVRCRAQKYVFSRRGSVLASISKLKKKNFDTIRDCETVWDHRKHKPQTHYLCLQKYGPGYDTLTGTHNTCGIVLYCTISYHTHRMGEKLYNSLQSCWHHLQSPPITCLAR